MFDLILNNLPYFIVVVVGVIAAICSFVYSLLNGRSFKSSINKLQEDISEVMKYRTANYQEKEGKPAGSTFNRFRSDYWFDETTGELVEKPEKIDIQAQINSHKDVALSRVLERLLPSETDEPSEVDEYYATKSELDVLTDAYDLAGDYIERYGLDEDSSFDEVIDYVNRLAQEQRAKLFTKSDVVKAGDKAAEAEEVEEYAQASQSVQKKV